MGATDSLVQKQGSRQVKPKACAKFLPTERTAFAKQLDILRGFAAASGPNCKPVTNTDVGGVVGMVHTTISMSNAFFQDVGFITKTDEGFVPSAEVVSYAHAYAWNPDTAAHKLAPLLERSWFCQALLPKLRFKAISENEAVQAIAEAAFAPEEKKPQLLFLLSYLAAAGIVAQENGQVRINRASSSAATDQPSGMGATHDESPSAPPPSKPLIATAFDSTEGVVQFNVSVKVNMGEFKGWEADTIQAFFGGIAQVLAAKAKMEEAASR